MKQCCRSIAVLTVNKTTCCMVFGTVLGTKVQKGHKGTFFLGEHHYTESKLFTFSNYHGWKEEIRSFKMDPCL